MRSTAWLSTIGLVVLLTQPAPPSDAPDGFHTFRDATFGCTLAVAKSGWLTLWFIHGGHDEEIPPPGWLLFRHAEPVNRHPDAVVFLLDGGRRIEAGNSPYLGITVDELREIVASKQVIIRATAETDEEGKQPHEWEMEMTPPARKAFEELLQYGAQWQQPKDPWLLSGNMALVIDNGSLGKSHVGEVQGLLEQRVRERRSALDEFVIVLTAPKPRRFPEVLRGVALFDPEREADRIKALQVVAGIEPEDAPQGSLRNALLIATSQKVQNIVLFCSDCSRADPADLSEVLMQLRARSSRLYVVWFAEGERRCECFRQLEKLAQATDGRMIVRRGPE